MKIIYLGNQISPSFYVVKSRNNIKGFSRVIETGDISAFDKQLEESYRVIGLTKRDYKGSFLNSEDAKNTFFDATVERIDPDERKHLVKEREDLIKSMYI